MKIFNLVIKKEKAGIISKDDLYIIYDRNSGHMYEHRTVIGLNKLLITNWRNDSHLVG